MRDTEREKQRHRQREKQAPCREPDVGPNPGTPGSRPEPKTDAQPLKSNIKIPQIYLPKWGLETHSKAGPYTFQMSYVVVQPAYQKISKINRNPNIV